MSSLVADTHSILRYLTGSADLSTAARRVMDETVLTGGFLWISAISLVESTYLVEKLRIPSEVRRTLDNELLNPASGVRCAPLDADTSEALRAIPRAVVPDMPDRIIAATALRLDLSR